MSQTFQALKCYQCHTYQVQIKKKSNRWECKVCGEKQSLVKIYGEGTSKDCRIHVQKLNSMRGTLEEAKRAKSECTNESERFPTASSLECTREDATEHVSGTSSSQSKWTAYVENDSENAVSDSEEEETLLPEIPRSKINTIINSKWTAYTENDSPMTHGMEEHGDNEMNLSNRCRQVKGQMPSAWNAGIGNRDADSAEATSTRQPKYDSDNDTSTPRFKRKSSEQSNCSTPKKLAEMENVESSVANTQNGPQQIAHRDYAKAFSLTESDELDEILKL